MKKIAVPRQEIRKQLSRLFDQGVVQDDTFRAKNIFKNRKIIVYGAGNGFIAFHNTVLERLNLKPALVLDQRFKPGDTFHGIAARSVASFQPTEDDKKNCIVVITIGVDEVQKSIAESLRTLGFTNVIKSSDVFEFNVHHVPDGLKSKGQEFFAENRKKIEASFALMSDVKSQEVFLAVMKTYLTQKPEPVPQRPVHEQYFPTDVPVGKGYFRFINCGAFDGDTVKQLQAQRGIIDALACFEPDEKNFSLLIRYLKENKKKIAKNIVAFPCGVFDREVQLPFSGDKLLCSSIFNQGKGMIQCVALDDVLPGFHPTFISFDIEGAEPEALVGATQLIRDFQPDLAVSVYHFPNHLWEIPQYLDNLKLGYRLYLRNYSGFTYETILYATAS